MLFDELKLPVTLALTNSRETFKPELFQPKTATNGFYFFIFYRDDMVQNKKTGFVQKVIDSETTVYVVTNDKATKYITPGQNTMGFHAELLGALHKDDTSKKNENGDFEFSISYDVIEKIAPYFDISAKDRFFKSDSLARDFIKNTDELLNTLVEEEKGISSTWSDVDSVDGDANLSGSTPMHS